MNFQAKGKKIKKNKRKRTKLFRSTKKKKESEDRNSAINWIVMLDNDAKKIETKERGNCRQTKSLLFENNIFTPEWQRWYIVSYYEEFRFTSVVIILQLGILNYSFCEWRYRVAVNLREINDSRQSYSQWPKEG